MSPWGTKQRKLHDTMVISFETMSAWDRQMDGRIDRQMDMLSVAKSHSSTAEHDKNKTTSIKNFRQYIWGNSDSRHLRIIYVLVNYSLLTAMSSTMSVGVLLQQWVSPLKVSISLKGCEQVKNMKKSTCSWRSALLVACSWQSLLYRWLMCLAVSPCVIKLATPPTVFLWLIKLGTHDLCANTEKNCGTDFQNLHLKIFGEFFKIWPKAEELSRPTGLF